MTAFLLDTNVLLWLVSTPDKIAGSVRDALTDPTNELIVVCGDGMLARVPLPAG